MSVRCAFGGGALSTSVVRRMVVGTMTMRELSSCGARETNQRERAKPAEAQQHTRGCGSFSEIALHGCWFRTRKSDG